MRTKMKIGKVNWEDHEYIKEVTDFNEIIRRKNIKKNRDKFRSEEPRVRHTREIEKRI